MASLNFISLQILVIFYTIIKNCESISTAIPPNIPAPSYNSPVPATSSDLPGLGPEEEPISPSPLSIPDPLAPAPDFYSPVSPAPSPFARPSRGIKAAYWPSSDAFPASAIDTSYFTHLYYAFLLPDPTTYKLNVTQYDQIKIPEFIGAIHAKKPHVKTLLSIGGGGNDPTMFSKMVSSRTTRAIFIESTIEVARNYGFHGVDLDWEFPANVIDMSNLALLYKQWHKALVNEARFCGKPRLLLTSAVYYASKFIFDEPRSYPIEAIRKYLDWVSPMCFDYHGSWENFTGVHSALYDPTINSTLSTYYGIGSWIQAGVPPNKLVMGLPLYGRTWTLQNPDDNGIGAPAIGVGPGGGELDYSQILDFNIEKYATVVFDGETVAYYSYVGDSWIGYDDVGSVRLKIQFARSRQLGGYFFWALGKDKDWTISKQASSAWGH